MEAMEKNREGLPLRRACISGAVGALLALLLLLACALCIHNRWLPQGRGAIAGRAVIVTASLCAAYLACRKQDTGKAVCAAVTAGIMLLLILLLGIFTDHSSLINMSLLFNLLCIIFGSSAGCLATVKRRRRRKRR